MKYEEFDTGINLKMLPFNMIYLTQKKLRNEALYKLQEEIRKLLMTNLIVFL